MLDWRWASAWSCHRLAAELVLSQTIKRPLELETQLRAPAIDYHTFYTRKWAPADLWRTGRLEIVTKTETARWWPRGTWSNFIRPYAESHPRTVGPLF